MSETAAPERVVIARGECVRFDCYRLASVAAMRERADRVVPLRAAPARDDAVRRARTLRLRSAAGSK